MANWSDLNLALTPKQLIKELLYFPDISGDQTEHYHGKNAVQEHRYLNQDYTDCLSSMTSLLMAFYRCVDYECNHIKDELAKEHESHCAHRIEVQLM